MAVVLAAPEHLSPSHMGRAASHLDPGPAIVGLRGRSRSLQRGPDRRRDRDEVDHFSWSELLDDLFLVRFSNWKPGNAAVSLPCQGGWYYIADSDLSARSTFVLLNQLFQLNSGGVPATRPILTLPVSR